MYKKKQSDAPQTNRVLARVLAEDLRSVRGGERGWSVVVVYNQDGSIWGMSNRDWDHD